MAKQLLGKEVNEKLNARIIAQCEELKAKGINPTLGIVRCGERPDDLSYEKGATSVPRLWASLLKSLFCLRISARKTC